MRLVEMTYLDEATHRPLALQTHPSAVCRTHLAFPLERVPTALVHERVPVVLAVAVAERRLDRLLARGLVELDPLL